MNGKLVKTITTNNNGVATYTYTAAGPGDYKIESKMSAYTITDNIVNYNYQASNSLIKTVTIKKTPAMIKLMKKSSSKAKKVGKKIYQTLTYKYKNHGETTGTKKFTFTLNKKQTITGKITKTKNMIYKYNKKTKKITVTIKNLAYNKIATLKFKMYKKA